MQEEAKYDSPKVSMDIHDYYLNEFGRAHAYLEKLKN